MKVTIETTVPPIFFLSWMVTLLFPKVLLAKQVYELLKCCGVTCFMMALCMTLSPWNFSPS